jgi:hypothetical protein
MSARQRLKTVVLAPMPIPAIAMTKSVAPRSRRRERRLKRTSRTSVSTAIIGVALVQLSGDLRDEGLDSEGGRKVGMGH